jgi:hypothetical protein
MKRIPGPLNGWGRRVMVSAIGERPNTGILEITFYTECLEP